MIDHGRLHWDLAAGDGFADRLITDAGYELGSVHPYHSTRVTDNLAEMYVGILEPREVTENRKFMFTEDRSDARLAVETVWHARGYVIADWHTVGLWRFKSKGSAEKGTI